ncbi:MAG TPA: hypothetical protein VIL77_16715 [Gaiellaceae bacterium]
MEGSNVGGPPAYVKHRSFLADRVLIVGPETRNLAAVVALDEHALTFVALAKGRGVSFQRSGTLGHQELSVSPREFTRAFAAAGVPVDPGHAEALVTSSGRWVDPVLRFLGADGVDSLDVSGYEKASIIHDLNAEIPADLEGRFTMLLDVGTLEHVFDFPTAIRNCMRMVEVGGHLILVLPTNNEAGHGFYQFSPELFFRVLAPEYGFTVEEMLIRELGSRRARWFRVADPGTRVARAQFVSRSVTYLFVLARRTGPVPAFAPPPLQSDYVSAWREGWWKPPRNPSRMPVRHAVDLARGVRRLLPSPIDRIYRRGRWEVREHLRRRSRSGGLFDRVPFPRLTTHFTPFELPDDAAGSEMRTEASPAGLP